MSQDNPRGVAAPKLTTGTPSTTGELPEVPSSNPYSRVPPCEDGLVRVPTELDGLHSVLADVLPCDDEGEPAVVYCWLDGRDISTILSDQALQDCLDAYDDLTS